MNTEFIYVKLKAVSPVHIGCAEVYEPTSFYVDKEGTQLVHFDTGKFVDMLDEKGLKRLSAICKKGTLASLIELMKFIQNQASGMAMEGSAIPLANGLVAHFEQTLSIGTNDFRRLKNEINRFEIMRSAYDSFTGELYIPGSAIKGAIRTSVLNLRRKKARAQFRGRGAGRKLQEAILEYDFRHLESDPFRLVKVSDFFPIGNVKRKIVYALDKKKRPSKFQSQAPYQILEVIESGSEFIGLVSVQKPVKSGLIKDPLSKEEIIKALETFYGKEHDRENRELSAMSIGQTRIDKETPIRIGRHSGAESVTIEGHRCIKIMQGRGKKPKYMDHATTIWVAAESRRPSNNSGLRPFGWMTFNEVDSNTWHELLDDKEYLRKSIEKEAEHIYEDLMRKKKEEEVKRAAEEQRQREEKPAAEEKARKEAEEKARREAELAKLPEQLAWLVQKEEDHNWKSDNSAFLNDIENFFEKFTEPIQDAIYHIAKWLDRKWPKILDNPDATKGKKKKPKYKERPKKLAKKVLESGYLPER